ncbi:CotH kinase family protein [Corynebacterium sputi]|uniref:CotH kinase family protein n=1 Tax=Corynebacterium sputi TaxID=489915 RepID=UPI0004185251|nr:CotH kinase family protein [Corynebacterium sputi]
MPELKKSVWRMNRRLVAVTAAGVLSVGALAGTATVVPYVTSSVSVTQEATATIDVGQANDSLFDASSHSISIDLPEGYLEDMVSDYQDDGDKTWFKATVVIDGVTIDDVGVRLKGNSTLGSLNATESSDGGPGGMMNTGVDADDPSTYPLLLSFDKYVDGRVYQGLTELSVRPGTPVVEEATALALTAETDQPSQRFAYTTYSINGGPDTIRLVIEVPDENYAAELGNGILYKADASSSFTYQGDDQSAYTSQFTQENGDGDGDLQPIINLLKWLDTADDAEFDEHLAEYVDVESFAEYLATQNLLGNGDDMAGPGQNYYLWWDRDTGLISVVSWDLNMSMMGSTDAGPDDDTTMGGGGGGMPGDMPEMPDTGEMPDMGAMPEMPDMPNMPEGMEPPAGMDGQGGPGMGGNELKSRFLESDAFADLYTETYWRLYGQMYGSGAAEAIVDSLARAVPATEGLAQEDIDAEISSVRQWVTARAESLAGQRSGETGRAE